MLLPVATLFSSLFFVAPASSTSLVNVTVDNTFGNPQENLQIAYSPAGAWSPGEDCTSCEAHVDTSQVHNGTWHDTTYLSDKRPASPLTASLTFDGVAIYVYCIVTRSSKNPFGNSDMTFYLDGVEVGRFVQPPNGGAAYHYSLPVYVNESIPSGRQHTFMLVYGRSDGQTALAMLDYIVFSRDNSTSTSTSAPSSIASESPAVTISSITSSTATWAITTAGIIMAMVVVAFLVGVFVYCIRSRRRETGAKRNWAIDSEDGDTMGDGVPGAACPALPPSPAASRPSLIPDPYLVSRPLGIEEWQKGAPLAASALVLRQDSIESIPATAQPSTSSLLAVTPSSRSPEAAYDIALATPSVPSDSVLRDDPWTTAAVLLDRTQALAVEGTEVGTEECPPSYMAAVTAGRAYISPSQ